MMIIVTGGFGCEMTVTDGGGCGSDNSDRWLWL